MPKVSDARVVKATFEAMKTNGGAPGLRVEVYVGQHHAVTMYRALDAYPEITISSKVVHDGIRAKGNKRHWFARWTGARDASAAEA